MITTLDSQDRLIDRLNLYNQMLRMPGGSHVVKHFYEQIIIVSQETAVCHFLSICICAQCFFCCRHRTLDGE